MRDKKFLIPTRCVVTGSTDRHIEAKRPSPKDPPFSAQALSRSSEFYVFSNLNFYL